MKQIIIFSTLILSIFLYMGTAFGTETVDYVVRFKKDANAAKTMQSLSNSMGLKLEPVIEELNIYKVMAPKTAVAENNLLQMMRFSNAIIYAQEDHPVTMREVVPNDVDFSKQWNLKNPNGADIKATEAWGLGTIGTNSYGQDIVVAVVDGGVDVKHKDLTDNIWQNVGEIAGNGVDDDKNGYIDDINGWNAVNNNGTLSAGSHATHVAGIVSARGDNGLQVSGVNWKVKVMSINGASGNTSVVLKAYGYVLKQKKIYIESNGKKGANVVATNSSFGVDYADCSSANYAAWNDIYNEMGKAGILSAAATANIAIDVDVKGDVPTGCTSDYLIAVTNTDSNDKQHSSSGWGKKTIDLGAPGTAILSTLPNDKTGPLTGTSMATPHVAGAVGFLYSVASPQLNDLAVEDPAKAALAVKNILLNHVDKIPSMAGKTVSDGRLNLKRSGDAAYNFVNK